MKLSVDHPFVVCLIFWILPETSRVMQVSTGTLANCVWRPVPPSILVVWRPDLVGLVPDVPICYFGRLRLSLSLSLSEIKAVVIGVLPSGNPCTVLYGLLLCSGFVAEMRGEDDTTNARVLWDRMKMDWRGLGPKTDGHFVMSLLRLNGDSCAKTACSGPGCISVRVCVDCQSMWNHCGFNPLQSPQGYTCCIAMAICLFTILALRESMHAVFIATNQDSRMRPISIFDYLHLRFVIFNVCVIRSGNFP